MARHRKTDRFRSLSRDLAFVYLIGLFALSAASADDVAPLDVPQHQAAAETQTNDAERERRENTVTIGVLLLVGVGAVGLLLIAAAIIWGAKVRRMVRQPDAQPTRQDDLWYLRQGAKGDSHEPPTDTDSSPPDTDDTRS